ncbi:hypothetical protein [Amycolatopsis minnesotensis]|uniref:Beta-ketoacyl synthase N-terminal domain-containing protein n=1 Tax=Amycolatopsis minnesotensis TaxID=337894 RepID=A0ABN2Q002_9PSEU
MKPGVLAAAIGDAGAEQVSGFIESPFNPLVNQVAARCLTASTVPGERTGMVLVSVFGDSGTTDLASELLVGGQPHNALLFMQATANAILGYLSAEFGISGPLLSVSTTEDPLQLVELLLDGDELDQVLLIGIELAATARTAAAHHVLGTEPQAEDVAVALLLGPAGDGPPAVPPEAGLPGLLAMANTCEYAQVRGHQGGQP